MPEQYELAPSGEPPNAHARRPTMSSAEVDDASPQHDAGLHRRTLRKLDWLLLPFLALLFLFNALDKSNVSFQLPFAGDLMLTGR